MNCILEMSFVLSVYLVINVFHLHHVDCTKVTIKKGTCPEFYDASVEDPNNRTVSWALNPEPEKLDCSICNSHDVTDSWLVTKSVGVGYDIKGIHLSVTMVRSGCQQCRNQDIQVYILHEEQSRSRGPASSILKKLPLLTTLRNEKDKTQKIHDFHFEPKAPAFSIVFRSAGSCTLIKDIHVYYFVCEKNINSLVNLPRTFAPAIGRLRVNSSCSENATSSDGREPYGLCSSNGVWESISSSCMCKKGYTSRELGCDECAKNKYKSMVGNGKCIFCPKNSVTSEEKIMCPCKTGFYRLPGENHTQPCYGVPSPVIDMVPRYITASSVTLLWKRPVRLFDQAVLYDVLCSKCSSGNESVSCKHPCGPLVTFKPSQNDLTYTQVIIEGLDENTEYQFLVYSKDQHSLRLNRTYWKWRAVRIKTEGSTKLSTSSSVKNVVIGILGAVVVVMAIVMSILCIYVYRLRKRERRSADYAQPTIELPNMRVAETGYEEPAQYQQLDSSRRVPIDANYQSLQNANYTQLNRNLKEVVQQYASLTKDGSSTTDNAPEQ